MRHYFAEPGHGVAWVTGASSGIGEALALRLAGMGFTVAATARSGDCLEALSRQAEQATGQVLAMPADVTDEKAMRETAARIVERHGPIALAVLNAGVYTPVDGTDLDTEPFHKSFAVNLGGVVNALVPAVRAMRKAGRGQVVIISSVTGYGGLPTSAAYGATKAALTNMAESLKFDLDKVDIRIQVVHPGFVDTPATRRNPFPMPALMQVDDAVDRIIEGLKRPGFEITFPRRFTYVLKILGLLPYPAYFSAVNRFTGWRTRPVTEASSRPDDSED